MSGEAPPVPAFDLVEHTDLVALPQRFCLYDAAGRRVDTTRHYTFDRYLGPEPETVDVDVPLRTVDEPVVYGGLVPKPHFGHFLMEAFTRLWPYDDADLHGVPHAHHLHRGRDLRPFETELMDAAMRDVSGPLLRLDQPTLLRRVLVPSQAIVLEQPIPERALRVYDRIRHRLAGDVEASDRPVYLSRSRITDGRRRTLGEVTLERRLADAGFRVVHPETLPLADQIRVVAGARVVVGLFGSALHLTVFRDLDGARTIALNPRTPSRLQLAIDRARGADTVGIRAEFPLHPRHPRINGGRSLHLGPFRNVLLPARTARHVLERTAERSVGQSRG